MGEGRRWTGRRPMGEGPMKPEGPMGGCESWSTRRFADAIAVQYNTSIAALANANGIENPSIIYVGQRLTIPGCEMAIAPHCAGADGGHDGHEPSR